MERKVIQVGERYLTIATSADGKGLYIQIAGHDSQGMYGSESITLDSEKCVEAFEALCEVMPGAVR